MLGTEVSGMARRGRLDPKVAALRDDQFTSSQFFDPRDLVQVKYEMVRRVEVDRIPASRAAAAFGFSRPSYYQAARALAQRGMSGLVAAKPGPRRAHKLTEEVLEHLRTLLTADPSLRTSDLVEAVADQFGVRVHPRSVERALARQPGSKSD